MELVKMISRLDACRAQNRQTIMVIFLKQNQYQENIQRENVGQK